MSSLFLSPLNWFTLSCSPLLFWLLLWGSPFPHPQMIILFYALTFHPASRTPCPSPNPNCPTWLFSPQVLNISEPVCPCAVSLGFWRIPPLSFFKTLLALVMERKVFEGKTGLSAVLFGMAMCVYKAGPFHSWPSDWLAWLWSYKLMAHVKDTYIAS